MQWDFAGRIESSNTTTWSTWPIKTRKKKAKTQPRFASNSQNLNAKFCGSEFLKSSWKFVMMKALKLVWFQNGKRFAKPSETFQFWRWFQRGVLGRFAPQNTSQYTFKCQKFQRLRKLFPVLESNFQCFHHDKLPRAFKKFTSAKLCIQILRIRSKSWLCFCFLFVFWWIGFFYAIFQVSHWIQKNL